MASPEKGSKFLVLATLTGSLGMAADRRLVVLRTSLAVAAAAVAAAVAAAGAAGSAGVAAAVGPRSLDDLVGTVAVLAAVVVAGAAAADVYPCLCTCEPRRDNQTRSHPRDRQECPGTCTARSSRSLIFYLCDLVL